MCDRICVCLSRTVTAERLQKRTASAHGVQAAQFGSDPAKADPRLHDPAGPSRKPNGRSECAVHHADSDRITAWRAGASQLESGPGDPSPALPRSAGPPRSAGAGAGPPCTASTLSPRPTWPCTAPAAAAKDDDSTEHPRRATSVEIGRARGSFGVMRRRPGGPVR